MRYLRHIVITLLWIRDNPTYHEQIGLSNLLNLRKPNHQPYLNHTCTLLSISVRFYKIMYCCKQSGEACEIIIFAELPLCYEYV